ncbi:hypothetical protein L376_05106 [Klebsiella pneumoniae MGH 30]|nr:hypothetical protein L376_05106 [Klebsiella pneumoniae MGH 30]
MLPRTVTSCPVRNHSGSDRLMCQPDAQTVNEHVDLRGVIVRSDVKTNNLLIF